MSEAGRKPMFTDCELITAVKRAIERTGDPMVRTDEIHESLRRMPDADAPKHVQTVRDRVDDIEGEYGVLVYKEFGSSKGWRLEISQPDPGGCSQYNQSRRA